MTTILDENLVASTVLTLSFASDMPPAMVEVVGDSLRTLETFLLRPGQPRQIETPEPVHSVCVHMPGGRTVVVPRSQLENPIERRKIEPAPPRAAQPVRERSGLSAFRPRPTAGRDMSAAMIEEGRRANAVVSFRWEWSLSGAKGSSEGPLWWLAGDSASAADLRGVFGRSRVEIRIPGNARRVSVQGVGDASSAPVIVDVTSRSKLGDMLLGYLQSADPVGRKAVDDVVRELPEKITDRFAACALSYMLLRVRRFDEAAAPIFAAAESCGEADGAVIAAWHLLHTDAKRIDEIDSCLEHAVGCGWPVYTEGLRLLMDALLMRGRKGRDLLEGLRDRVGQILWSSPLATLLHKDDSSIPLPHLAVRVVPEVG